MYSDFFLSKKIILDVIPQKVTIDVIQEKLDFRSCPTNMVSDFYQNTVFLDVIPVK